MADDNRNKELTLVLLGTNTAIEEKIKDTMKITGASASPLSCLLLERWIVDGTAAHVSARIKLETLRRAAFAVETLGLRQLTTPSFHVFLPLTLNAAQDLAARSLQRDIRVTAPSVALDVEKSGLAGIRLCLGSPSFDQLKIALHDIRELSSSQGAMTSLPLALKPIESGRMISNGSGCLTVGRLIGSTASPDKT